MQKNLRKSTGNKMLCGVCAGVAKYFEVDPTLVRLAWVALALFAGGGIILYIIAAILMPNDDGNA